MEIIKIGFKKFEIVEELKENTYKAKIKDKFYYIRCFPGSFTDFYRYHEDKKKFNNCGVRHPKIVAVDKKNYIVVTEFINGETILDMLIKDELPDIIYEKIFLMTYLARIDYRIINPDPSLYRFDGKELYYMSEEYIPYSDEEKFVNKGIRLWFYTDEFETLLKEKGRELNKSRRKADYEINKKIVLLTCKFYH